MSSGGFGPALEQFLGSAAGLSAATITRLTAQWQDEAAALSRRDWSGTEYVYLWGDGIHLEVRLEQTKLCLLMIGVRGGSPKSWSPHRWLPARRQSCAALPKSARPAALAAITNVDHAENIDKA